jgi:hypothetical protein
LNEPTIVTPSVLIVSPIVFDNFHYESFINNTKELKVREEVPIRNPLQKAISTWKIDNDGLPMVDYSSQDIETINNCNSLMARKGNTQRELTLNLLNIL